MGGALDSNCWSGKILMSFFLGLYVISEVSTAFSLLNEGFFLMHWLEEWLKYRNFFLLSSLYG